MGDIFLGDQGLEIIKAVQSWNLDWLFSFITFFGDEIFFVAIIGLIYWSYDRRLGLDISFALLSTLCINTLLKGFVGWERPFVQFPEENLLRSSIPSGYSFPSGHSQSTGTFWPFLALRSSDKWRKYAIFIAVIMCILIPLSRLALGVHWPSDVVVGLLIGLIVAFFAYWSLPHIKDQYPKLSTNVWLCIVPIVGFVFILLSMTVSILAGQDIINGQNPGGSGGLVIGMFMGLLIERKWIRFSTDELETINRIIRAIIGLVFIGILYFSLKIVSSSIHDYFTWIPLTEVVFDTIRYLILGLGASVIPPLIFVFMEKKLNSSSK